MQALERTTGSSEGDEEQKDRCLKLGSVNASQSISILYLPFLNLAEYSVISQQRLQ